MVCSRYPDMRLSDLSFFVSRVLRVCSARASARDGISNYNNVSNDKLALPETRHARAHWTLYTLRASISPGPAQKDNICSVELVNNHTW